MRLLVSLIVLFLFSMSGFAADRTYNADVCIIGGGTAGTTAAVSAVEKGLSVVLLEKMPALGGSGNFFEGTYACESPLQLKENSPYTKEFAFQQIMGFHHWRIDPKVTRTIINASADNIRFMLDHGIEFEGIQTMQPKNANRTWHIMKNNTGGTMIKAFVKTLQSHKNATILTETPGKSLLQDAKGKIIGAIGEDADGNKVIVHSKAVIVATGGFSMNREMVEKYLRFPLEGQGAPGRVGDGINMLMAVGAETENMDLGSQAGPCFDVDGKYTFGHGAKYLELGALVLQPLLHVDMTGDRFFDESQPLEFMSNAIEARGGRTWHITNQAIVDGLAKGSGLLKNHGNMFVRGDRMPELEKKLEMATHEPGKVVVKAETLKELASKTGMDYKTLKASVDRISKYAHQGYDEEFYKERKYLRAMDSGPYYAVKTVLKMFSTLGGAKINEKMQVINKDGDIIPGLYALGQDAGGLYSDSYDMQIAEGFCSAFAIAGGRLSIQSIKADLHK